MDDIFRTPAFDYESPALPLHAAIGESQNWRCCYCGVPTTLEEGWHHTFTIDPILPIGKGGKVSRENFVGSCERCNHARGDLTAMMFFDIARRWQWDCARAADRPTRRKRPEVAKERRLR